MDAFRIHSCDLQVQLQLGSNNLQETKHLCVAGPSAEGRGRTNVLHGFILAQRHVRHKRLHRHEYELACCRAPGPHLLQHVMGKHV
jgi:hypothetical protein